jgi:hypothetical protein
MNTTPIGDDLHKLAESCREHGQLIERKALLDGLQYLLDKATKTTRPGLELAIRLLIERTK